MQGQREHMSQGHRFKRVLEGASGPGAAHPRLQNRFRLGERCARVLRTVLEALIPRRCAACDAPCAAGDLCRPCRDTLEDAPEGALALAPFAYGGALAEAVRHAKFRPDERPARALSSLFCHAVLDRWPELRSRVDVVTWVPLHARRLRSRGFDLSALIAASLARELGVPCRSLLRCARHDPPLSRGADVGERARRVHGRYRAVGTAEGSRVLLIDDVVTTGATLAEATLVLEQAGAAEVVPMALAATASWSKTLAALRQSEGGKREGRAQGATGSPLQSLPRNMRPHMRKSARRDQTG